VQVIQAITKTLSILDMVNEMTSVVGHSAYRLDLTSEIARLNGALRMMGARDNDRPPRPNTISSLRPHPGPARRFENVTGPGDHEPECALGDITVRAVSRRSGRAAILRAFSSSVAPQPAAIRCLSMQ
jgi:hypothetical protein